MLSAEESATRQDGPEEEPVGEAPADPADKAVGPTEDERKGGRLGGVSEYRAVSRDLARKLSEIRRFEADYRYYVQNPGEFEHGGAPPDKDVEEVRRLRDRLLEAAMVCRENRETCTFSLLTDTTVNLPRIPARRETVGISLDTATVATLPEPLRRDFHWTSRDFNNWTDLHYSAMFDLDGLAEQLVLESDDPTSYLRSALHTGDGRLGGIVVDVLQSDGHPQGPGSELSSLRGQTPLHIAAFFNSLGFLRFVVQRPDVAVDLSVADSHRESILHYLLAGSYYRWREGSATAEDLSLDVEEAIDLLVRAGLGADTRGRRGWTPLMNAARWGYLEAVRGLLKATERVDPRVRKQGRWRTLRDVMDVADRDGATALHHATRISADDDAYLETIAELVKYGADVTAIDASRQSVLHSATASNRDKDRGDGLSYERYLAALKLLVAEGAPPNALDRSGRTACELANADGNVLRILSRCGLGKEE